MSYLFTPALETRMRLAWALPKPARSAEIDRIVASSGIPRASIKERAIELGLPTERRHLWTAEDDKQLLNLLGTMSVRAVARKMRRGTASIKARAHRLDLSGRPREGYSKPELRKILGAPVHRISAWLETGWLGVPCDPAAATVRVSDAALVRFIFDHMDEIDFRLADQTFLKGVLRNGKRKSFSGESLQSVARRSPEARHRSRRAARDFQNAFPFGSTDSDTGGPDAWLGQGNAGVGVAAQGIWEESGGGGRN